MSEQHVTDSREFRRFRVKDGNLAVIRGDSIMTAPIIDINMKGLALHYMKNCEICPAEAHKLDIFSAAADFFLTDLPFEMASESETTCNKPHCVNPMQRCGIKFGELSPDQISQLNYFIKHHTENER